MTHSTEIETSTEFYRWAGSLAPALRGHGLSPRDLTATQNVIIAAHHGTTHLFDRFDVSLLGNPEGAFGAVHYFTSCEEDARHNYACEGPDMRCRINHEAEQLGCDIELDPQSFGLDADAYPDICHQEAAKRLLDKYHGGQERVIDCYLKLDNPFLVYGRQTKGETNAATSTPALFNDLDDIWLTAETEVLANNGILYDPGSEVWEASREIYEEEILDRVDEIREEYIDLISVAMMTAARDLGTDAPPLPDGILEDFEGLTHDRFYRILSNDDAVSQIEHSKTGAMISSAFVGKVIEAMGFDSIVLLNANEAFPAMDMYAGTTHIHVFAAMEKNIRMSEIFESTDDHTQDLAIAA
jgi:hypothetical protein